MRSWSGSSGQYTRLRIDSQRFGKRQTNLIEAKTNILLVENTVDYYERMDKYHELAQHVRPVMTNDSLRDKIGLVAGPKVQNYAWDHCADKAIGLYREVTGMSQTS